MNKIKLFVLVLVFMTMVTGCDMFTSNQMSNIESTQKPFNNNIPIKGTWAIYKIEPIKSSLQSAGSSLTLDKSTKLFIDSNLVAIGGRYSFSPEIKAKYINVKNYFSYKYKDIPISKDVTGNFTTIYTISDGDKFYQDIIVLDKDKIMISYEGIFYFLSREQDVISKDVLAKYQDMDKSANGNNNNIINKADKALLLGVKVNSPNSEGSLIEYRTYFIKVSGNSDVQAGLSKELLLPRKTGFWDVGYTRIKENEKKVDEVFAFPTGTRPSTNEEISKNALISSSDMEISYVGPDYLSVIRSDNNNSNIKSMEIHNIDILTRNNPLNILEIAGSKGQDILYETRSKEVEGVKSTPILNNNSVPEKNIGIYRNNGKWTFRSFIDTNNKDVDMSKQFDLNIIPIINILKNDELAIKWSEIKATVQNATDAFSSPDKEIVVIQTPKSIDIYKTNNLQKPIKTIPIQDASTVVMAEWAMGKYVQNWEEQFSTTNKIPINYDRPN